MTEVLELPITKVKPNPQNARSKLTRIEELAQSIETLGLIEPLIVRKFPGTGAEVYMVVNGHRRLAACQQLKHKTVQVILNEGADAVIATRSIATTTAREGLSAEELAGAVEQLVGLEMSDEEIARSLAIDTTDVGHARKVAAVKKANRKALEVKAPLTLEQAAALAEFADSNKDLSDVRYDLEHRPAHLAHTLQKLRDRREREAKIKELVSLRKGEKKIPAPSHYMGPPSTVEPLCNLTDEAGKSLTEVKHAGCKGRAYWIENTGPYDNGKPKAVSVCLSWQEHGHLLSKTPKLTWSHRKGAPAAKATKADKSIGDSHKKLRAERLAAWQAATNVRDKWLDGFLMGAPATWTVDFCLNELASLEDFIELSNLENLQREGSLPKSIKRNAKTGEVPQKDVRQVVVAMVVTELSNALTHAIESWGESQLTPADVRFLTFISSLKDNPYGLSEIEEQLIKEAKK